MHADRDNQQHQRAGLGQRLVSEAVQHRPEGNDDQQRQRDLRQHRQRLRAILLDHPVHRQREHQVLAGQYRQPLAQRAPQLGAAQHGHGFIDEGQRAHGQQQPAGLRRMPGLHRGQRERAVGNELPLRDEDDARHREHQHQGQCQQRVDRARGDAVLGQDGSD
ncbi:hypothetical protein D3C72_1316340 [compost metagenome]